MSQGGHEYVGSGLEALRRTPISKLEKWILVTCSSTDSFLPAFPFEGILESIATVAFLRGDY
jgi:hypothetical protein